MRCRDRAARRPPSCPTSAARSGADRWSRRSAWLGVTSMRSRPPKAGRTSPRRSPGSPAATPRRGRSGPSTSWAGRTRPCGPRPGARPRRPRPHAGCASRRPSAGAARCSVRGRARSRTHGASPAISQLAVGDPFATDTAGWASWLLLDIPPGHRLVRAERLELSPPKGPGPKPGASAVSPRPRAAGA